MLLIHPESHLDHAILLEHLKMILDRFKDRTGFFIETFHVEYPVPCSLYGPIMGDEPIDEIEVVYKKRGERAYPSRLINWEDTRWVYDLTVIAGPHGDLPCVLYTAFGGPPTPKEPNDPTLKDSEREESIKFWSVHALCS